MRTATSGWNRSATKRFLTLLAPFGVILLLVLGIGALAEAQSPDDPTQSQQLLATFAVDAFQTDLFTASASAQIPIQVPIGPTGLAPKLAIGYNSSSVDQLTKNQQGSGAGYGWNLDTGGFILRDMGTTASTTDDKFTLIFGGASYSLIKIDSANQIYHTSDESFLKVQYFSTGDYWVLTTKDGLQHRFGFNTDSKMIGLTVDLKTAITWRYFIDEVKTASGVSIRYAYSKVKATAKGTTKQYDQAVYLDTVTYAYRNNALIGPAREVRFLRALRTDWHDTTSTTFISLFEKERLDSIEVRVGGGLVRKYVFGFDYSIANHLTLKTVTTLGSDGVSALPSQSFTYFNDKMVLDTAYNGIGGSVTYTYEAVKNIYLNAVVDAEGFCSATQYLSSGTSTCFVKVFGYLLRNPAPNTVVLYSSYVENGSDGTCTGQRVITNVLGTCGGNVFGYLWTIQTTDSVPIYLVNVPNLSDGTCTGNWVISPNNNSTCGWKVYGYAHAGDVGAAVYNDNITGRGRNRVLSRTTKDGLGWSSTTNYISYNPAVTSSSSTGKITGVGYAQVRSIDPLGHYTDTFFFQDIKRGRTSRVEVRNSAGVLFSKIVNTWLTKTPFTNVTLVYLSQVDKYKCDGDPTCLQTAQTFAYDANGNPTQTTYLGDVSITGDERTEKTDWSIDSTNWIHRPIHLTLTDSAGATVRERWLTYNSLGLLTKEENRLAGLQGNAGNPVVTYTYDVFGNRTSTTDALGCTTNNLYESSQTYPATVTTCLGHQTSFTYDLGFGVILSQTDPNLQTTTSEYDVFGRLTKKTGPLDTASTYGSMSKFYLDFGDPNLQRIETYTTEEHGTANVLVSEQYFDGLGRADHARTDGPGGTTIVTDTTYDVRGKVENKSAPYFLSSETPIFNSFTYDAVGRQTKVTHPDGTFATTSYLRDLTTQTDENGNVKRKFLDAYDRLKRVEEVNGAETYVTTYEYNVIDALTKVTNHLGHVTTMTYDLMGRKITMSDPNMGNWTYSYDKAGNLISQTDAKGQTLTFTYDLQSRMTTKTYPDNSQINWTYDVSELPDENYPKGRLAKVIDLTAETRFVYDQLGRVTKTERKIDGTPHVMTQQYNALDKITSETFPDGDSANYSYDAGALNRVFDATSDYVTSISYNARGQKKTIQYGNGVTSNFTYNDTGAAPDFRLSNHTTAGPLLTFQNLAYDYDNVGNITSIGDGIFTAGRSFTYDALNRLASATGTFGSGQSQVSRNYTYDAIGNILSKDGVQYFYEDPNHPSAVTRTFDPATSTTKNYAYDANSNTASGNGRTFAWTVDNRVASVTMGSTVYMDYDYTGIRIKKTSGSALTVYPFAGYEIGPDGTKTKYFKVGNELLAAKQTPTADPEKKLFYHNDHLGGVNVITKLDGTQAQLTEYDPWGKVSRSEGNADPSHRFTGQELDPESGLYYYGGRYYDAELARFVSPDIFVPQPKDPQSLNRYSYVLNNPVRMVDPTGHFFLFDDIIEAIIAIVEFIAANVSIEGVIKGMVIGVALAAVQTSIFGGSFAKNMLIGGLGGGIIGSFAGPMFSALKGGPLGGLGAAAAVGAVGGTIVGGLKSVISGGNFWKNVGLGALTGAVSAAVFYGGYMLIEGSLISEPVEGAPPQRPDADITPNENQKALQEGIEQTAAAKEEKGQDNPTGTSQEPRGRETWIMKKTPDGNYSITCAPTAALCVYMGKVYQPGEVVGPLKVAPKSMGNPD